MARRRRRRKSRGEDPGEGRAGRSSRRTDAAEEESSRESGRRDSGRQSRSESRRERRRSRREDDSDEAPEGRRRRRGRGRREPVERPPDRTVHYVVGAVVLIVIAIVAYNPVERTILGWRLRDEVPGVRRAAAEGLAEHREKAVEILVEIIQTDEDLDVKRSAARSLGLIGRRWPVAAVSNADCVAPLARLAVADPSKLTPEMLGVAPEPKSEKIINPDAENEPEAQATPAGGPEAAVRLAAAYGLGICGMGRRENGTARPIAGEVLALMLDDPDVKVRKEATRALAKVRYPTGVAGCIKALRDSDAEVRKEALKSIRSAVKVRDSSSLAGPIQDKVDADLKGILAHILNVLGDKNQAVQKGALTALDEIADAKMAKSSHVLHLLDDETDEKGKKIPRQAETKVHVITILTKINDQAARNAFLSRIDPEAPTFDPSPEVRAACVKAIAKTQAKESYNYIAQRMRRDESADVRLAAAKALGELKRPSLVRALADAIIEREHNAQPPAVLAEMLKALRNYGPMFRKPRHQGDKWRCIQALADILSHPAAEVAREVPATLAKVSNISKATAQQWKEWYGVKKREREAWGKAQANARQADTLMNPSNPRRNTTEAARMVEEALTKLEKIIPTADPEEKSSYLSLQKRLSVLKYGIFKGTTVNVKRP